MTQAVTVTHDLACKVDRLYRARSAGKVRACGKWISAWDEDNGHYVMTWKAEEAEARVLAFSDVGKDRHVVPRVR